MIDDNLKFEFEDKLQNYITKIRELDVCKEAIKYRLLRDLLRSINDLFGEYFKTFDYNRISRTLRHSEVICNSYNSKLLIDMIELLYCTPRQNRISKIDKERNISAIDKERKIHDFKYYLDEKETCQIFDFSDKRYNIIGNLLYKRYRIENDDSFINIGHEMFDLYRNSFLGNGSPLKYSFYDTPTKTEINRYISSLVYMRDIGYTKKEKVSSLLLSNSDCENAPSINKDQFLNNIVWEDVEKHIELNGIETKIKLSSLSQVDFDVDLMTRLSVVSVPVGASIWLDGLNTGWETDSVLELMPGKHIIEVKLDGYKYSKKEVELTLDNSLEVEFRLEDGELDGYSTFGLTDLDSRYVHVGRNIVWDTRTDLEWLAGPDRDTDWYEAKFWLSGLKIGKGGWRLPSLGELESIYEIGLGDKNMTPKLEMNGMLVWSNEITGGTCDCFHFLKGSKEWAALFWGENNRVFAVRSRSDYYL
jgi:hypothetical protein